LSILQQYYTIDAKGSRFETQNIVNMEIIERKLYDVLSDSKGPVREMCSHIMEAGGKRVRPLLVLNSGLIFGDLTEELTNAAVAAELIHMASLVHDDIIDESGLRRNKPSINKLWGNHYAVLCGDYLFAKAFGILSNKRLIKSMDYMVHAIQSMCQGEILQASDRFSCNINMKTYYERISMKTAIFLECCCKSGAAVAGTDKTNRKIIGEYGLNMGLAFQIVDDILDFCGDTKVMGKPKGEDLLQGTITIPVIFMLRDKTNKLLIEKIMRNREVSEEEINEISIILGETGCIKESFRVAQAHVNRAKYCLSLLPKSEYNEFLNNFADMLQARIN
jgi:heptaprenyl diphosphate synthase